MILDSRGHSFGRCKDTDLGTTYIGYAYVDDEGNEEYYGFPYEEILDGAIECVPLS